MSLSDYTYIAGLGCECATTWQIMRAAGKHDLPTRRYATPFDWFQIALERVVDAVGNNFSPFFDPASVQVEGRLDHRTWKIADVSGTLSWHHLRFRDSELAPGTWSWFQFGIWLGERMAIWKAAVTDPSANILFVRAESAVKPDDPATLSRLVETLSKTVAGNFRLVTIAYDKPARLRDPRVLELVLEQAWPSGLPLDELDWNADYGKGVAWRGSNAAWDEVWARV